MTGSRDEAIDPIRVELTRVQRMVLIRAYRGGDIRRAASHGASRGAGARWVAGETIDAMLRKGLLVPAKGWGCFKISSAGRKRAHKLMRHHNFKGYRGKRLGKTTEKDRGRRLRRSAARLHDDAASV